MFAVAEPLYSSMEEMMELLEDRLIRTRGNERRWELGKVLYWEGTKEEMREDKAVTTRCYSLTTGRGGPGSQHLCLRNIKYPAVQ